GLDRAVAPLRAALERADQHPTARLALARTLIALDAKESAGTLLQQTRTGNQQKRGLVEPALSQWKYQTAHALLLRRLCDPGNPTARAYPHNAVSRRCPRTPSC